jgi:hypothetical protein
METQGEQGKKKSTAGKQVIVFGSKAPTKEEKGENRWI